MRYDITGPVKVSETKSFLLLVLLVALVGGGIALALHWNRPKPPATASLPKTPSPPAHAAARPRPAPPRQGRRRFDRSNRLARPVDPPGDFVEWPRDSGPALDGTTFLKAGPVYLDISLIVMRNGRKVVDVWRSYPHPEKPPMIWSTAYAVERILAEPKVQKRYDVTPEQLADLKALDLKIPALTAAEQKTIADLFLEAHDAEVQANALHNPRRPTPTTQSRDTQKKANEAVHALQQAAKKLTIPSAELDALTEKSGDARDILRPDQRDLIDSGFDRTDSGFDTPGYPRHHH